jgi:predicted peptidase
MQINFFPQTQLNKLIPQSFNKKETIEVNLNYLLYLPENYNSSNQKFPLVIFLHGSGERGNDLEKVKMHGPPKLVEKGQKFPFILLSPQCPEGKRWTHFLLELSLLINEIQSNYSVDENRIYLTGLSMGGQGTWALAMYNPDKFAAIAPICGWSDDFEVCKLKNLPVWVFHGAKDFVVPIENSEKIVQALKNCGSDKIKFTIYPEATHDSWTETYNNPEFYEWILSNRKE